MTSVQDVVLQKFRSSFELMQDHPDSMLIKDLTNLAKFHIEFAYNFVSIIIGRLISPTIHAAFKLPIFYLMDSIMKLVGGPYASFFEKQLSEVYTVVFTGIHEKDRKKLDFLIDTWRDRKFLQGDLPSKMKLQLYSYGNLKPSTDISIPARQEPLFLGNNVSQNSEQAFNNSSNTRQQASKSSSSVFADLVRNDMIAMLHQMFMDINPDPRTHMPLDELAVQNPALWAQLRQVAIGNATEMMNQRSGSSHSVANLQPSQLSANSQQWQQQQQQQPQHHHHRVNYDYHAPPVSSDTSMRKRDFEQFDRLDQRSSSNSQRQKVECQSASAALLVPDRQLQQRSSGNPSDSDLAAASSSSSKLYVNGFICETTVVLDVDRTKALSVQMASRYSDAPPAMPAGFYSATRRVVRRLDAYFQDLFTPPQLPQILFGPLPPEALLETASTQKANGIRMIRAKLPVPEFKPEELGRNPESALRALYADRPHQFHEDGLRFSSLAELKRHTDEFLERKKLLSNKAVAASIAVREYREWYCLIRQWVTDFRDGSSGHAVTAGAMAPGESAEGNTPFALKQPSSSASQQLQQELFLVPADENFPRCPVSREMFECEFDEEQGEMVYLNAAKVLVAGAVPLAGGAALKSAGGDSSVFGLGKPTEEPSVRYLIVHKLLVLDTWLALGQAVSLRNAVGRLEQTDGGLASVERLRRAAGGDESEDDIFVLFQV